MTITQTETYGSDWIAKEDLERLRRNRQILGYRLFLDEDTNEWVLTYTYTDTRPGEAEDDAAPQI